jgi:hypothetical protein
MFAPRRKSVNRALEAVERVRFALHYDFKRFVIVVAAYFACNHESLPANPGVAAGVLRPAATFVG